MQRDQDQDSEGVYPLPAGYDLKSQAAAIARAAWIMSGFEDPVDVQDDPVDAKIMSGLTNPSPDPDK